MEQEPGSIEPTDPSEEHDPQKLGERLRQLAEDEEARVEAEQDEPTVAADDDEEVAVELTALDEAKIDYIERIMPLLGEDAQIVPCPYCEGNGYLHAELQKVQIGSKCESCDGWGQVLTGSRIAAEATTQCRDCMGRGWKEPLQIPTLPTLTEAQQPQPDPATYPPLVKPQVSG